MPEAGTMENMVIPAHVAIILDGNGRWAKKRGLPRAMGHKEGCRTVKRRWNWLQGWEFSTLPYTVFLQKTGSVPVKKSGR